MYVLDKFLHNFQEGLVIDWTLNERLNKKYFFLLTLTIAIGELAGIWATSWRIFLTMTVTEGFTELVIWHLLFTTVGTLRKK